jgi:hypothetical protein
VIQLAELVHFLKGVDDFAFGEYQLRRDPLYAKIPAGKSHELIREAMAAGRREAQYLKDTVAWQDLVRHEQVISSAAIEKYLGEIGVAIVETETALGAMFVLLASYTASGEGGELKISKNSLAKLEGASDALDATGDQVRAMILAHELYHHIETHTPRIFTQTDQVVSFKFFNYTRRSKLRGLSEIAANSFSQELLGSNFSPRILEVVTAYLTNPEFGQQLVLEIAKISAPVG